MMRWFCIRGVQVAISASSFPVKKTEGCRRKHRKNYDDADQNAKPGSWQRVWKIKALYKIVIETIGINSKLEQSTMKSKKVPSNVLYIR